MALGRLGSLGTGFGRLGDAGSKKSGPLILLSNTTISDTASIGDTVGTLSVSGGTGSYTFTLDDDDGGNYSISGTSLQVAASLSAGSDSITIKADNGAGSVVTRAFLITVTHSAGSSVPTFYILGF